MRLHDHWHNGHPALRLLLPLSWLFSAVVRYRRHAYQVGKKRRWRSPVPVIVVGNVTVGGTGKTPLTKALVEQLQQAGWKPGIVSRGYGGMTTYPHLVGPDATPAEVGDEPVFLARRTGVPVVVDPQRPRAVQHLLTHFPDVNVIVSDDGLQHYALARDIEIIMIDGQRGLGSGWLLPAGPLREPATRVAEADFVVLNGPWQAQGDMPSGAATMVLEPAALQPVSPLDADKPAPTLGPVHAVAGIGHPPRFFELLASLGYGPEPHPFPDHHAYRASDLRFSPPLPVIMTEKDAVKCARFAPPDSWYVPVEAKLPEWFWENVLALLAQRSLHAR